ncbi:RND family transporter [Methanococcoides sp. AM1]|uniref:efflux RND transporter permease subunit n=1 Tax=Methanococcoides sp. AM1 TaxID=1201011 RepID=UPI00108231A8|nr:RND family transporter [Methanococcoides sp. AM1]
MDEGAISIKNVFEKLGIFIENNTIPILIVALLFVLVSAQGAQNIAMESGTETFVEKTSQLYQDFDHLYMNIFGTEAIVIMVEDGQVNDPALLQAMDRLDHMSSTLPGVVGVQSVSSFVKDANFALTGEASLPEDKVELESLLNDYVPEGLMPDDTHTLIYVEIAGSLTDDQKQEVLREVETSVTFAEFPPDYNVIVTGEPAFMVSMNNAMMSSMGVLLGLSVVLMIVVLYLVFGHVRWRLMPLAIVLLGIIYTFGAMGYLEIPMTMVSMAAFPVLIGLGIDYAIQFHNRIEEELERGETPAEAVVDTIKHTGPAVLIALIITALGFFSLLTSSVPMIQDFAKLLLIGIVMCFLASLFVGVTVIYGLDNMQSIRKEKFGHLSLRGKNKSKTSSPGTGEPKPDILDRFLGRTTHFTIKHPFMILSIAVLLCAGGLVADTQVGIQTDTETFVPQDLPALINLGHLSDITGGEDQLNIIIKTDNVADPETLKWVDEFSSHEVDSRNNIIGAESMASVIKSMNGGMIPESESEIRSLYEQIPAQQKDRFMYGENMLLLNLNIGDVMGSIGMEGVEVLADIVREDMLWMSPPPGMTATITGSNVVFIEVIGALTSGRIFMTYLGLGLVFGGLLLIYRDLLKALVPVVTMFMVIGWSGGLMYLLGMEYNPMTATLGALILGVGSEYAVLMMERYFEEKAKGASPEEAMTEAGVKIGKAIVTSGLTTLFGFCALVASDFNMISGFGMITVIDVGLALFATFVIFPPVMVLLDNFREKRKAKKIILDRSFEDDVSTTKITKYSADPEADAF